MKYIFILSVLFFSVYAIPIGKNVEFKDATFLIKNGTRSIPHGQAGFATLNGGTTGGAGGTVWTVWDAWALRNALSGNDRRIIYIRGRIDLSVLFTSSPGIALPVGHYKSIIGGDSNAMIFGGGLRVTSRQIIIQNIKFHNAISYAPGERPDGNGGILNQIFGDYSEIDAIEMRSAQNVWVDHCEFADDPWNANNIPNNGRRHDGLIDIIRGANWISISNSIFRNHDPVTLVGNSDSNGGQDIGTLKTTFYLNWYQGTIQRNPRVRFGEVHVLNNLYTDVSNYGIGIGVGARVYAERNLFINTRRAWGYPAGIPNPPGFILNFNNWLDNSNFESGIPAGVGWVPSQYYLYSAIAASSVGDHVRRYAGTW